MLIWVLTLLYTLSTLVLGVTLFRVTKQVASLESVLENLDKRVTNIDTDLIFIDAVIDTLEPQIDDVDEKHASHTPDPFDVRIAQFREDLNNPTYPENVAQTLHPNVYNIPHESIQDVPIKFTPEYAD